MTRTPVLPRAFSLIEVLISVVVLALGLLGLAAVFPVVVAQQRQATDTVQGISMERSIAEYLEGQGALRRQPASGADLSQPTNRRGWRILLAQPAWSPEGQWNTTQDPGGAGLGFNAQTGEMYVSGPNAASSLTIPAHERLFPKPYSGGTDPRYIWDMAARRALGGNPGTHLDDSVQVAIFVRRVDSSIRRPSGRSLADVLTNNVYTNVPTAALRVPVAQDNQGRPTGDGMGGNQPNFSPIATFTYTIAAPQGETVVGEFRFIIPDVTATQLRPYFYQIGQKFVDQAGVVHEVVEIERGRATVPLDPPALRLEPPISREVVRLGAATGEELYMLFTPQVPVSVTVRTIRP